MCGPKQALNLYPKKGCVAAGSDADVVIIDPEAFRTFGDDSDKGGFNVYQGVKAQGRVETVLVMGKVKPIKS